MTTITINRNAVTNKPNVVTNNLNETDIKFGDYGNLVFFFLALNATIALIMTFGTISCYLLPSFKDNCEGNDCIKNETTQWSIIWLVPKVVFVILVGGYMGIIPFRTTILRRETVLNSPVTTLKKRLTFWGWVTLVFVLVQTIALTILSSSVIDDRCHPKSLERARKEGRGNMVTRNLGFLSHGAQNNFGYNLVNAVSIINPRYLLWITILFCFIFGLLSMSGKHKALVNAHLNKRRQQRNTVPTKEQAAAEKIAAVFRGKKERKSWVKQKKLNANTKRRAKEIYFEKTIKPTSKTKSSLSIAQPFKRIVQKPFKNTPEQLTMGKNPKSFNA